MWEPVPKRKTGTAAHSARNAISWQSGLSTPQSTASLRRREFGLWLSNTKCLMRWLRSSQKKAWNLIITWQLNCKKTLAKLNFRTTRRGWSYLMEPTTPHFTTDLLAPLKVKKHGPWSQQTRSVCRILQRAVTLSRSAESSSRNSTTKRKKRTKIEKMKLE